MVQNLVKEKTLVVQCFLYLVLTPAGIEPATTP